MTKAKKEKKKYGEPYGRRSLLRRGDIKSVAEATGFAYNNIVQQMNGDRTMHITVRAMLDNLADKTESFISNIENTKE